ncbi:GNAT family N-acetyltransferase [Thermoanaerobacterium saccharolyticum]|uniref:N-acetyltransferase GCN5 n=2 Tax=Thermoanaerobacterium TaxID=28895 RepID=W9EAK3_9THEO|nr:MULTISPECIES: GNAT family N-acetyltransferase [Thermoanaerobacterium]AFK86105.1 GCN5-related N-acetyltransferase [Thermoanaerobacterium saccharolyticum JW/SL-YS485]ETO39037.1 N-acetyltransferase GCN5 [Thermoanaerobacterium aotearoense SCUT27]
MEEIRDIKVILKTSDITRVLAESVYNPTQERLMSRVDEYTNNTNVAAFGYIVDGSICGVIVLDTAQKEKIIILDIAVSKSSQHLGIGSKLINYVLVCLKPSIILAETDDDAVGFYRKYGFEINNLGEKYPNIKRYECKYVNNM